MITSVQLLDWLPVFNCLIDYRCSIAWLITSMQLLDRWLACNCLIDFLRAIPARMQLLQHPCFDAYFPHLRTLKGMAEHQRNTACTSTQTLVSYPNIVICYPNNLLHHILSPAYAVSPKVHTNCYITTKRFSASSRLASCSWSCAEASLLSYMGLFLAS